MIIKKIIIKIILWLVLFFMLGAIAYGIFFLHKINSLNNKVNITNKPVSILSTLGEIIDSVENKTINLKQSPDGRINVLLLGVAGKGKPGQNLTDTIIILSINLKTNQVALISLPRDFYIASMKINSVYQAGLNNAKNDAEAIAPLLSDIKEITSLEINYYVILDFDGFEKVINSIGGINITNDRDIFDARYPGPSYTYEIFELKKGFQHLDGKTALKYARERHDDPDGDFGRSRRQQQIIQAVKNRVFSASTFCNITVLNNLFNALGDDIKTNISQSELGDFFELTKKLNTANIINTSIDAWNKDSLLKVSHIFYGDIAAFILIPRVGNYSEIQDLAQNIFNLDKLKRRQDEIVKEDASIILINASGDDTLITKIKKLLSEKMIYKNVTIISNPLAHDIEDYTVAYDLTNGTKPFTLDELSTKLPAMASYSLPDKYKKISEKKQTQIILIIGKDLISRYNMAEDSIEDFKKAQDNQYFSNPNN